MYNGTRTNRYFLCMNDTQTLNCDVVISSQQYLKRYNDWTCHFPVLFFFYFIQGFQRKVPQYSKLYKYILTTINSQSQLTYTLTYVDAASPATLILCIQGGQSSAPVGPRCYIILCQMFSVFVQFNQSKLLNNRTLNIFSIKKR